MKIISIVLRNKKNGVLNPDFASVIDELMAGGYFSDEVLLLPYDEVGALHLKIRAFLKEGVDLLCVVADKVLSDSVKHNLAQTFSFDFDENISVSDKTAVCVLPAGEAGEKIVKEKVVPRMNERLNNRYERMIFRMVGAPQEKIDGVLNRSYAVSGDSLSYNYNDDYSDQRLEVIYDSVTPKMIADQVTRIILEELKDYIYALDDTPLEKRVYEGLSLRKYKLSVCESFTGGRISARMVKVPGVSEVFNEGLNTYSNQSKRLRLGVSLDTLKRYGAVSAETAREMAEGLLKTECSICAATTGIAGPNSDDTQKPVGLCYIAVGIKNDVFVHKYQFQGDRECVTQTAVNYALFQLLKLLKQ